MIDMAMGQQDLLDLDILLFDRGINPLDLAARIDHGRLVGFGAPQDRAVLLEGGDGNNDGFHVGPNLFLCVSKMYGCGVSGW